MLNLSYMIIGAPKCGTGSLYKYVVQHPLVEAASRPDLHFFDDHFDKGLVWYRQFFPLLNRPPESPAPVGTITGEVTSFYLFHPLVPERVKQVAPGARFIFLVRNPTDRAYVHFRDAVDRGLETLSFFQAIKMEAKRLERGRFNLQDNPYATWERAKEHSYISQGLYAEQFRRWLDFFPREQFLILDAQAFFDAPVETVSEVYRFLELPEFTPAFVEPPHENPYAKLTGETRLHIDNFFSRYNEDFYRLAKKNFGW
ncbi:MAG: sulfotransferase domain-containing protein [Kiritimatiellae bacterium]|nr:sulfotransferase domain-containing protein [Kiritimatiellia bacterium]